MAHGISFVNGRREMAYVGQTPWHGLGSQLEAGATIETWQSAAGMDWTIHNAPVNFLGSDGVRHAMSDRVVLFRSDTQAPLGVVSDGYRPVHPGEVLEFFRDLTGAAGFTLDTAGTLFGGKRLWALASIGAEAAIADPRDKVKGFLLLSTACDGSMATEARYTTVRVVCNNTLGFARSEGKANVKVTHRTTFVPDHVKRELGIEQAQSAFADAMAQFRQLAETDMRDPLTVINSTARLFHSDWDKLEHADKMKLINKPSSPIARVGELAMDRRALGSELSGTDGTAWGWLNAVTQYVDHESRARTQDTRLNSAWYGKGAEIKAQALEVAMALAGDPSRTIYRSVSVPQVAPMGGLLEQVLEATVGK